MSEGPPELRAEIQGIQQNLATHRHTLPQTILGQRSSRTPNTLARDNVADVIEQQMQRDSHSVWGLVIYRCDYGSELRWSHCLSRIRGQIHETLHQDNGTDLLDSLRITVMSDKDVYAGLNPTEIRSHFGRWREQAIPEEQKHPATDADYFAPRYAYCLQVDAGSLYSITDRAKFAGDVGGEQGYVNVISAIEGHQTGARPEYYTELGDDNFDTGWMKVPYQGVIEFAWYWVGDVNAWYTEYRPPPQTHAG